MTSMKMNENHTIDLQWLKLTTRDDMFVHWRLSHWHGARHYLYIRNQVACHTGSLDAPQAGSNLPCQRSSQEIRRLYKTGHGGPKSPKCGMVWHGWRLTSRLELADSRPCWTLTKELSIARPSGTNPDAPNAPCLDCTESLSIFEEQSLHSKQELFSFECFAAAATRSLDQIITRITHNGYICCSRTKALLNNEPSFNLEVLVWSSSTFDFNWFNWYFSKNKTYHRTTREEES